MCFPVTIAATAIFSYAWFVPLALWGFLLWRNKTIMNLVSYSFMEIVCVYGYSLSIYIPAVVRPESQSNLVTFICNLYFAVTSRPHAFQFSENWFLRK